MSKTAVALVVAGLALVGCGGGADYFCQAICNGVTGQVVNLTDFPKDQDACASDAVKAACSPGSVTSCACVRVGEQEVGSRRLD